MGDRLPGLHPPPGRWRATRPARAYLCAFPAADRAGSDRWPGPPHFPEPCCQVPSGARGTRGLPEERLPEERNEPAASRTPPWPVRPKLGTGLFVPEAATLQQQAERRSTGQGQLQQTPSFLPDWQGEHATVNWRAGHPDATRRPSTRPEPRKGWLAALTVRVLPWAQARATAGRHARGPSAKAPRAGRPLAGALPLQKKGAASRLGIADRPPQPPAAFRRVSRTARSLPQRDSPMPRARKNLSRKNGVVPSGPSEKGGCRCA